jgi:hypothetical protein
MFCIIKGIRVSNARRSYHTLHLLFGYGEGVDEFMRVVWCSLLKILFGYINHEMKMSFK